MNGDLNTVLNTTISGWTTELTKNLTTLLPIAFLVLISINIVYFTIKHFRKLAEINEYEQAVRERKADEVERMRVQTNNAINAAEIEIKKQPLKRG